MGSVSQKFGGMAEGISSVSLSAAQIGELVANDALNRLPNTIWSWCRQDMTAVPCDSTSKKYM